MKAKCLLTMLILSIPSMALATPAKTDASGPIMVIGTSDLAMCVKTTEAGAIGDALYWCNRTIRRGETSQPGMAVAYLHRGVTHLRLHDLAAAQRDIDQSLMLAPDYGDAYFNRANVQFARGDYPAALASYDQAYQVGVTVPEVLLYNRAATHRRLSNNAQADSDMAQARSLMDPESILHGVMRK